MADQPSRAANAPSADTTGARPAVRRNAALDGPAPSQTPAKAPTNGASQPSTAQASTRRNSALDAIPDEPTAAKANAKANGKAKPARRSVLDDYDEMHSAGSLSFTQMLPPITISLIVHMLLLIILGLISDAAPKVEKPRELVAVVDETPPKTLDVIEEAPIPINVEVSEMLPSTMPVFVDVAPTVEPTPNIQVADIMLESFAPSDVMTKMSGGASTSIVDSRSEANRKQTVVARGGNEASEAAVAKALEWLAQHQSPDGGWSMDHTQAPSCRGKCPNPGAHVEARMGATALGLLPFLGAGQTHKQGKYKKEVQAALFFIVNRMKVTPNGGDCSERRGTLYSHGLCSIALCEAFAMSQDKSLAGPAQLALNYISYAQDQKGGGWRYAVGQPGDTSVVGWQLMALKSGHMSKLAVRPETVKGASRFLDAVQSEGGVYYGYLNPDLPTKQRAGTTAVGLLCRMYLGWKHEEPALEKGVQFLAKHGPSKSDVYFNYYATQVLHHFEGNAWSMWNNKMRDQLVETQSKNGHEAGSWFVGSGGHANDAGGRLYCTSLSCMTLEVYYRHLPLYKKTASEDEF